MSEGRSRGDLKWKRKRTMEAKLKAMREAKMAKLAVSREEPGSLGSTSSGAGAAEPLPGPSSELPENQSPPEESDSENERPGDDKSSSDSESDFDQEKAQTIIDDWMVSLPSATRKMLSVVLVESFMTRLKMKSTAAALEAASITGFNEKTVRRYRKEFYENKGHFKEEKRGKYQRQCLFNDENLRMEAAMFVRENGCKKGEANLNAKLFCQWVNNDLLPSSDLPPNLPRMISVRTATRWLHRLGFRKLGHKKGAYVDGHEREDVVAYRREYLDVMKDLRDTHLPPPLPSDERPTTPPPDAETRKKLVLIYHDESIFNTNEGQQWFWGTGDEPYIQPKTKGAGIMVSDFVDQHNGYLQLSEEEHCRACVSDPNFPKSARVLLEYGAEREGYWTSEKFMANVKDAAKIAKFKYRSDKHTVMFIFDQSSCHRAFSDDALNARVMNVRPGGAQPAMRDTIWAGRVQKMVDSNGVPKGMRQVLEERGINTAHMKGDDMRTVLANHEDFRTEKTLVEHFLHGENLKVTFLPKFHCELNPIERVWGQAKVYTRMYTNFTLPRLRNTMHPALDSVTLELIRKYFRKVLDYEKAYLDGKKAGKELEQAVKVYKSHRRVFFE